MVRGRRLCSPPASCSVPGFWSSIAPEGGSRQGDRELGWWAPQEFQARAGMLPPSVTKAHLTLLVWLLLVKVASRLWADPLGVLEAWPGC